MRETSKTALQNNGREVAKKKISNYYVLSIAWAIINAIYAGLWLTTIRSWGPEWASMWPAAVYVIMNIAMTAYVLIPKLQRKWASIIAIVIAILLLLINLLALLTHNIFSSSWRLLATYDLELIFSIVYFVSAIRNKKLSRTTNMILLGVLMIAALVTFAWNYYYWWQPDVVYAEGMRTSALILAGVGGVIWMIRTIGWLVVLMLINKSCEK